MDKRVPGVSENAWHEGYLSRLYLPRRSRFAAVPPFRLAYTIVLSCNKSDSCCNPAITLIDPVLSDFPLLLAHSRLRLLSSIHPLDEMQHQDESDKPSASHPQRAQVSNDRLSRTRHAIGELPYSANHTGEKEQPKDDCHAPRVGRRPEHPEFDETVVVNARPDERRDGKHLEAYAHFKVHSSKCGMTHIGNSACTP